MTQRFPYRLAAIDLDETLLGSDKRISTENLLAVKTLARLGVQIALASGRRYENMIQFQDQLGLLGPIVSCNGALVIDPRSGKELYHCYLPQEAGVRLCEEGLAGGRDVLLYHLQGTFAPRRDSLTDLYESRTMNSLTLRDDLGRISSEPLLKIIWLGEPSELLGLRDIKAEAYPECEVVITDPEYLEFSNKGATKAKGLAKLAAVLEIPQCEVLAFGDGNNDASMLEWAGLGVAMPHARASAIAAADMVAPAGDPETAFAGAVNKLLELNAVIA